MHRLFIFIRENRYTLAFFLLILSLFVFIIPESTTPGKYDRRCWINWANYILGNGLGNIYKIESNYLPLYHYVLFLYGLVYNTSESIILNINSLKYVTVFFELIGVFFIIELVKHKYKDTFSVLLLSLVIVFNPAFFYDSVLYGQVDGIYATFLFLSVFYALKKNPVWSIIWFVLALNMKLQAVSYAPIVFCLNLIVFLEKFSFPYLLKMILPGLVLQTLILLPFIVSGDGMMVVEVARDSQGRYPFVSMGAYNFWHLVMDTPKLVYNKTGFWGRSYHVYGLMLYAFFTLLILLPIIRWNWNILFGKKVKMDFPIEKVLLMCVLMSLVFFYFNTEMHARYVHAAMIFAGAYALYTKRFLIYGSISLAYFLNLEATSKILKGDIIEYTYFFFNPVFVSLVYLFAIILCFYKLYWKPGLFKLF